MEEIMRFTIQADSTTFSPHGPWVRYEAHAKAIAELRAELHDMTVDRNLWQDDHNDDCPYLPEVAELRTEVERLSWKLITPESLPKIGDEVTGFDPAEAILSIHVRAVSRGLALARNKNPQDRDWERLGYTHYRPINPPQPQKVGPAPK
jgi:hypothetical protein